MRSTPTPTASTSVEGTSTPSAGATPTAEPTATPTTIAPATPTPGPAQLIITSLPWHVGEVGINYAPVVLGASGGTPPYSWSIAPGTALPAGLTL